MGKGGRYFLSVHQPKGTSHAFLDEVGRFAKHIFLYQLILFREMA